MVSLKSSRTRAGTLATGCAARRSAVLCASRMRGAGRPGSTAAAADLRHDSEITSRAILGATPVSNAMASARRSNPAKRTFIAIGAMCRPGTGRHIQRLRPSAELTPG